MRVTPHGDDGAPKVFTAFVVKPKAADKVVESVNVSLSMSRFLNLSFSVLVAYLAI